MYVSEENNGFNSDSVVTSVLSQPPFSDWLHYSLSILLKIVSQQSAVEKMLATSFVFEMSVKQI